MEEERHSALHGRRILIVEDEPMIAMTLEDMLSEAGCAVVGTATQVSDALQLIATGDVDGAVLDVNLGAEKIDLVADELARLGRPFIFTTGYGAPGIPHAHLGHGILQKPFRSEELATALAHAFQNGA